MFHMNMTTIKKLINILFIGFFHYIFRETDCSERQDAPFRMKKRGKKDHSATGCLWKIILKKVLTKWEK